MDPLTDLLSRVRTSGAIFNQSFLSGSWAVRFEAGSPMELAVPLRGFVWVMAQGVAPVRLGPGDVAVLCGGIPYVVADDPATEPTVVIRAGGRCTTVQGDDLIPPVSGVSVWGTAQPDSTLLLSGLYTVDSGMARPLLAALPPLAVVEAKLGQCPVGLFEEISRAEPGQQALLDRTLDLLLIIALRAWFTRPGAQVPAWYRAHGDPVVGPALRLLHANPAHPWTLAALASATEVSRANLARRFTALVGQPPMTYLREWRLTVAADLLREPDATLAAVASQVGFANPFALSAAFKRERGISPKEYRTMTAQADT
ncbi:AraC family transcriptional regulator [Crossiella sp. NPDC003009]